MFKIFSFGMGDLFNLGNIERIGGIMQSFLDNIDIEEFTKENEYSESSVEDNNISFIRMEEYDDMYLLTINLYGINIRELSIRYDPGIIEINLNRSEIQKSGLGILSRNMVVRKSYNKKFENIEEIEISRVLKSIDDGILSMRMPKKYLLENEYNIIEVESYEDNVDN
ncbi:Hsp20/alpha crystallin family protein [Clostridium chromiireducens]|uniref:Hsp20 family protein n=1 Tax=Clostridium chromiireducens TaxID=225345 RepID=A0A1V4J0B8_9CLOT|nr:Hsp20/alpha crystallin family protein [Clostridium chromiireducens]MVX64950.1 Hsp20 family protein [Clostridium chromiireducens]OPJ65761.1 hypothetical protein CLCHR_05380 [Clostridium chromiireducens]RII32159.1 Hsp20/alpha crystallin family protein [Clostridium chromiireducens]